MSCCCRIDTEQILANFFAKLNSDRDVTVQELENYLNYLSERFPIYVSSNLSQSSIQQCVEKYPRIYGFKEQNDHSITIHTSELVPNLKYFNTCFSEAYASFIERTTEGYFRDKGEAQND